jgi:hypothetical protein
MLYDIDYINETLMPVRQRIIQHPLYEQMKKIPDIQVFMKYHVFAVWDFMSLLKSLQRELTCTQIPWVPKGNASTRSLINEIVKDEESDVDIEGKLYLDAMDQTGADTSLINACIESYRQSQSMVTALQTVDIPPAVREFVQYTFNVVDNMPVHVQAAVFTFSREDLIPDMFIVMVEDLNKEFPGRISRFKYYLERHIEVDGDRHSLLGKDMVRELCGNDAQKWEEAARGAKEGLEKRLILWDGILAAIKDK